MARRRGFGFKIPGLSKIPFLGGKNGWIVGVGLAALLGIGYLAYSGRQTGVGFVDRAADTFEDVYEDYVGPLGPAGAGMPPAAKPMRTAPVIPSAPGRGMNWDDMMFSGAYATDSPLPYVDWWNNDTSVDDRIIVA